MLFKVYPSHVFMKVRVLRSTRLLCLNVRVLQGYPSSVFEREGVAGLPVPCVFEREGFAGLPVPWVFEREGLL